jgi:hypothetical protein
MKKRYYKNIILLSILLLVSILGYSQKGIKPTKEVEGIARKMFVDMVNRDYDAILEMTHPKVYEIVPKNQMRTVLKSTLEGNSEFSIDFPKTVPNYKLSNIFKGKKDDLQYAFVSYDLKTKMTFHNQEFDEETKKMMVSMMKVKGMFVKFISKNSMNVLMKDRITIILRDNSTKNNWVMINYDPDSPLSYQLLSTDLLEASKRYKQSLMLETKKKAKD